MKVSASILMSIALLAGGSFQKVEVPARWQCQRIGRADELPQGYLVLMPPVTPVLSVLPTSSPLDPTPIQESPWQPRQGVLVVRLLDGRVLVVNPVRDTPAKLYSFGARVNALATSASGDTVAVATIDGGVHLIDVADREVASLSPSRRDHVQALAIDQSEEILALAYSDGAVEIWSLLDVPSLVARAEGRLEHPFAMVFSTSGERLAVVSVSGNSIVYKLTARSLVQASLARAPVQGPVAISLSAGELAGIEYFTVSYSSGIVDAWKFSGDHLRRFHVTATPSPVRAIVDPIDGSLLAYAWQGDVSLIQLDRALRSDWGIRDMPLAAEYLRSVDSVVVGTDTGRVVGFTVGEKMPRFSLSGFPGFVQGIWNLEERGLFVASVGSKGILSFFQVCVDDLKLAFESRLAER